jgi:hypothetical protein
MKGNARKGDEDKRTEGKEEKRRKDATERRSVRASGEQAKSFGHEQCAAGSQRRDCVRTCKQRVILLTV